MKKDFNQKGVSTVVIVVIIAIILLAAGAFFMMKKPQSSVSISATGPKINTTKTAPTVSTGEMSGTFDELVGKGQSLECDFVLPSSDGKPNPFGTGKLYTTGSKGRSMMTGNTSGMSMEANAIYKEGMAYSWVKVGETTMGFKFDKDKMKEMSSGMTPQQIQQGEQFRAKMNFKCKPWTPDESKFILPTGVEFK